MAGYALAATVRPMSDAEVAWFAGLMEGEGSFMVLNRGNYLQPRMSLGSTDLDVLERIVEVTGTGGIAKVSGQANRFGTKQMWHWRLFRQNDIRELCVLLRPWMSRRRTQQLDAVMETIVSKPERRFGYCVRNLHLIEGSNRVIRPDGSGTCRACMNTNRREKYVSRRATPCTPQ